MFSCVLFVAIIGCVVTCRVSDTRVLGSIRGCDFLGVLFGWGWHNRVARRDEGQARWHDWQAGRPERRQIRRFLCNFGLLIRLK